MPRILIIDDDVLLSEVLRLGLIAQEHEVFVASDGRKGVALCASERVDLVITDMVMPNQEGLETVMALRRRFPVIKIIAMSGGGRNPAGDYLKVAKKIGAVATLSKPFSIDELTAAVRTALNP